jgi:hypothetical protein
VALREGLAEFGDLFVEVGQRGFEGFAMVGVGGAGEIVADAGLGELEILDALFAELLRRGLFCVAGSKLPGFGRIDYLSLYVLTFPTSRHTPIFAQIALMGRDLSEKVSKRPRRWFWRCSALTR